MNDIFADLSGRTELYHLTVRLPGIPIYGNSALVLLVLFMESYQGSIFLTAPD